LAVERPPVHPLRPAPPLALHPAQPVPHQRTLPDPTSRDDARDVRALGPGIVEPLPVLVAAEELRRGLRQTPDGDPLLSTAALPLRARHPPLHPTSSPRRSSASRHATAPHSPAKRTSSSPTHGSASPTHGSSSPTHGS